MSQINTPTGKEWLPTNASPELLQLIQREKNMRCGVHKKVGDCTGVQMDDENKLY